MQPLPAQIATGDVGPERQREAGLEQPPLAEVDHLLQALGLVGELTLVDQQPGVGLARLDRVEDLVERDDAVPEVAQDHPQDEERGRHLPGHGDLDLAQLVLRHRLPRDDDRPVARAHARPVREQRVALLHERVRVQRDRRHLEPALERPLVQRLDVAEHVLELEAARVDAILGQGPEHEGIVGVGAVAEADQHRGGRLAAVAYRRPKNQRSSGLSTSARLNGWRRDCCPSCSETRRSSSRVSLAASSASWSS